MLNDKAASDPMSRLHLGYVPEWVEFPVKQTAEFILNFHRQLLGLDIWDKQSLESYLKSWGVEDFQKRLGLWSKGMRQRLALAICAVGNPRVIILDEPNTGLDPIGIALLGNKLQEWKTKGCSILLSSHRLAEVFLVADRILVLNNGKIISSKIQKDFGNYSDLESWFLKSVGL